jgi:hypothetical protein
MYLSIPKRDRIIADDEWADIARRIMSALGFEEGVRNRRPGSSVAHRTSANGTYTSTLPLRLFGWTGAR